MVGVYPGGGTLTTSLIDSELMTFLAITAGVGGDFGREQEPEPRDPRDDDDDDKGGKGDDGPDDDRESPGGDLD